MLAFHLNTLCCRRNQSRQTMVKIVLADKEPAHVLNAAKEPLVSVMLGLRRLKSSVSLSKACFAETFMAKLDYQIAETKNSASVKGQEYVNKTLLLKLPKNAGSPPGQII